MNAPLRFFVAISLALAQTSCTTAKEKSFAEHVSAGRCDEALIALPEHDPLIHLASESKQAAGTLLSYSLAGANYTAEVLWDVAGGTVMVIGLCAVPLAVIGGFYAAAGSNPNPQTDQIQPLPCLPGKITALGAPPLGRHSFEATKDMRCPDLKSLSHSLRSIAACYEAKGGKENLAKAEKTLIALQQSQQFYQCLPLEEQQKIANELVVIQDARADVEP